MFIKTGFARKELKRLKILQIFPFSWSISLFLNAPCHGWQVSKQAMDGLPEKTERYSKKTGLFQNRLSNHNALTILPGPII